MHADEDYVKRSIKIQNEIISGVILDIDKLRELILQVHKDQLDIRRTFVRPQLIMPRPKSVPTKIPRPPPSRRPQSVPNMLPRLPSPPTITRQQIQAPRKYPTRPVLLF